MTKNYIREEGKVTGCVRNIAQMNIFEYIKYFGFPNFFSIDTFEELWDNLLFLLQFISVILFYPIVVLYHIYYQIHCAKKEVQHWEELNQIKQQEKK